MLNYGKTHEESVLESQPGIGYLSHELAGIHEGPDALTDQSFMVLRPCCSFIKHQVQLRNLRHKVLLDHVNTPPDFFLRLVDHLGEVTHDVALTRSVMRSSPFTKSLVFDANEKGLGDSINNPQTVVIKGVWTRPVNVRFGIGMLMGRDPCEWFQEENINQDIPTCLAETARVSIQCMLLSLEYLRMCAIFELPPTYIDLGLYTVRKELNFWNLELLLSYVVGAPRRWEAYPNDNFFGTTFEPMAQKVIDIVISAVGSAYQVHTADTSLLTIIAEFFNNSMTPLADIAHPTLASPVLGAYVLDPQGQHRSTWSVIDEGFLPPAPLEVTTHRRKLATFRVAAAVQAIPNPGPSIWKDHILPMILVSLPYGVLKFILYNMKNTNLVTRYELARQVCVWRVERSVRWLQEYGQVTGKCILWKRQNWTFDARRLPSLEAFPVRYRWIEVPFLLQKLDRQGRVNHIFDFKRYYYGWQEYEEGRELEARLRDIDRSDAWYANTLRNRVLHSGIIIPQTNQEQQGEGQAAGQAASQTAGGTAPGANSSTIFASQQALLRNTIAPRTLLPPITFTRSTGNYYQPMTSPASPTQALVNQSPSARSPTNRPEGLVRLHRDPFSTPEQEPEEK